MGEGDDRARAVDHEDQGRRAPGAQVLRVDWRLHPRLALDVPADVDLEAGVRRVWTLDRAPQVLLSCLSRGARRLLPLSVAGGRMLKCIPLRGDGVGNCGAVVASHERTYLYLLRIFYLVFASLKAVSLRK